MKIAVNHATSLLVFLTALMAGASAHAQGTDATAMVSASAPVVGSAVAGNADMPFADVSGKTGEDAEHKIPEQVENIVKKLKESNNVDMSLEDMNQARAALARLELLVDIEQKLTDLEEVRRKRDEASGMIPLLPAQAVGGIPMPAAPVAQPVSMPMQQLPPPPSSYDVVRIVGTDSDFTALVGLGEGRTTMVQVGDVLPDGSQVSAITRGGVKIKQTSGKDKILRVSTGASGAADKGKP